MESRPAKSLPTVLLQFIAVYAISLFLASLSASGLSVDSTDSALLPSSSNVSLLPGPSFIAGSGKSRTPRFLRRAKKQAVNGLNTFRRILSGGVAHRYPQWRIKQVLSKYGEEKPDLLDVATSVARHLKSGEIKKHPKAAVFAMRNMVYETFIQNDRGETRVNASAVKAIITLYWWLSVVGEKEIPFRGYMIDSFVQSWSNSDSFFCNNATNMIPMMLHCAFDLGNSEIQAFLDDLKKVFDDWTLQKDEREMKDKGMFSWVKAKVKTNNVTGYNSEKRLRINQMFEEVLRLRGSLDDNISCPSTKDEDTP